MKKAFFSLLIIELVEWKSGLKEMHKKKTK